MISCRFDESSTRNADGRAAAHGAMTGPSMAAGARRRCCATLLLLRLAATAEERPPPPPAADEPPAIDDESMLFDALELVKGPFMTVGLATPQQRVRGGTRERDWGLRRTKLTGEVAASANPFAAYKSTMPGASTRDKRWKLPLDAAAPPESGTPPPPAAPAGDEDPLLLSIWHRGTAAERRGASAHREIMDTALVVHDRAFSVFKPAGEASYCSSVHGPHCPQLRDRFAEDSQLEEIVELMAGQPEMDWWSSGAKDRDAAFHKLIEAANADTRAPRAHTDAAETSSAAAAAQQVREVVLASGRERQQMNIVRPGSEVLEEAARRAVEPTLAEKMEYLQEQTDRWKAEQAADEKDRVAKGL
jgi:hypothetical protein